MSICVDAPFVDSIRSALMRQSVARRRFCSSTFLLVWPIGFCFGFTREAGWAIGVKLPCQMPVARSTDGSPVVSGWYDWPSAESSGAAAAAGDEKNNVRTVDGTDVEIRERPRQGLGRNEVAVGNLVRATGFGLAILRLA